MKKKKSMKKVTAPVEKINVQEVLRQNRDKNKMEMEKFINKGSQMPGMNDIHESLDISR